MAAGATAFFLLRPGGEQPTAWLARLPLGAAEESGGALVLSGFIEAEEIELAPELGGRVVALPFAEGDEISEGDMLLDLDTALLEARRDAMQARLDIAEAQRDLLARGVREEAIAQAEAQVAVAQAAAEAARKSLDAAWMVRNEPQDVAVRIAEVEAQIAAAQHQVNAANAGLRSAEKKEHVYEVTAEDIEQTEEIYGEQPNLYVPLDLTTAPQELDAALEQLNNAQSAFNRANELLAALQSFEQNPQQLQAQVVRAQTALETAEAEMARAQAQLDDLKAGPTSEQMQSAEGRVGEAEAAVAAVETQIRRMTLTAPASGVLLEQTVHPGELAAPGMPVITLADLDTVELTVYVTAGDLDRVALQQQVDVSVNSFPGETFEGTIMHISDEAEFTPSGVQTEEQRVNLVYAVKIRLPNPGHQLKPGMPADVTIR